MWGWKHSHFQIWEEIDDALLAALDALQKNETAPEAVAASEPSVWCSEAMRSGLAICGSEALRSFGLTFYRGQCRLGCLGVMVAPTTLGYG